MRELFEVAELVRVAVEDERSGVAFYGALARKDWGPQFQKLFGGLCEQEKYHRKRFEEMLAAMGNYKPREQYSGEYMEYLRAMTDSRAFPDEKAAEASAEGCESAGQAIEVALQFERDTLILLSEMKPLVPPGDHDIVEEIAREEQTHLVALADAKRMIRG